MLMEEERKSIVEHGKFLHEANLSKGTSGNISIFNHKLSYMAITPSGIEYEDITIEDIVIIDILGNVVEGTRKPSSEWKLHLNVYEYHKKANAIVHAHAPFCTTFACLRKPLEAVHYGIASARTNRIPVVPYETFGSLELANHMKTSASDEGLALLLANHGIICWGADMNQAYHVCCSMEELAELMWRCLSIGEPSILSKEEINVVIDKFQKYGQEDCQISSY